MRAFLSATLPQFTVAEVPVMADTDGCATFPGGPAEGGRVGGRVGGSVGGRVGGRVGGDYIGHLLSSQKHCSWHLLSLN